jgi:modification methylase
MQTDISVLRGTASHLELADESVDLIVTSPPYPMVEMWDLIFAGQEPGITAGLAAGRGRAVFELMHQVLDRAWAESYRVLKNGGIACINIGDATRTLNGDFQLYANHARILSRCVDLGFASLPDILWRKPTNAPNKFMGSGMLPVGAYVTYEHEYILILRKGDRRQFKTTQEKERRRRSAFFWEERNLWFSDLWSDIRGTGQVLGGQVVQGQVLTQKSPGEKTTRQRSAAFPFELAYRLVCMFSLSGDVVLDPFAGTGTTLAAALAAARNAVGIELDEAFIPSICDLVQAMPDAANAYSRERLWRHSRFVAAYAKEKGPLKHANIHYGFPVMTAQEKVLVVPEIEQIQKKAKDRFVVSYPDRPRCDFMGTESAQA